MEVVNMNNRFMHHLPFWGHIFLLMMVQEATLEIIQMPRYVGPVENVTVPVGREAILTCTVDNLGSYKVAWVNMQTQTILTIHTHVITRSHRIGLSHTDSWTWNLHIRQVKKEDEGYYMCQLNTDPMMSQSGYLRVVVPPDILDYPTSTDMVVREGTNVTLRCAATGSPQPTIVWRKENKEDIYYEDRNVESVEGPVLNLNKVDRRHMGAYLCIASNGIPPTVSRLIRIIVHFPPMITVPNQLIGATEGDDVSLECNSEAYPKSINYWIRGSEEIIVSGDKYITALFDELYKVTMLLTIKHFDPDDAGNYTCLSKNSLGSTESHIKVYPLIRSTMAAKTTTLPSSTKPVIPREDIQDEYRKSNRGGKNIRYQLAHNHTVKKSSRREESSKPNVFRPSVLTESSTDKSSCKVLERSLFLQATLLLPIWIFWIPSTN